MSSLFRQRLQRNTVIAALLLGAMSIFPFLLYSNSLIIDTSGEHNLDPADFFSRIQYAWDSRPALGQDSFPRLLIGQLGGFYALLSGLSVPVFVVQRAWFSLLLFASGLAMYYFTGMFKLEFGSRMLSSVFYVFNPYTLVLFNNTSNFFLPYAALPLLLGIFHKGLETSPQGSVRQALLIGVVWLFATPVNITFVVILTLVLASYFVYYIAVVDRTGRLDKAKFASLTAISTTLSSSWWLLPGLYYYFITNVGFISANLLGETPLMYNSSSSYVEVFRLLGFWGFYSAYKEKPYFNYSATYLYNPFVVLVSLAVPILCILALVYKANRRRLSEKIHMTPFLIFLVLISVFMAVGAYPPESPQGTGLIYRWLYDSFPGFQIFRGGYKFQMLQAFAYAGLFGLFFNESSKYIKRRFSARKRLITGVLLVTLLSLVLIDSYPFFTGSLFQEEYVIDEVPAYWNEFGRWISGRTDDSKIFMLPDQYFPVYVWGCTRTDVAMSLVKKPQIARMPGSNEQYVDEQIDLAYLLMKTNSTVDWGKVLGLMNVGYILQRNDINWTFYDSASPNEVKSYLSSQENIRFVQSFGQLDLYENVFYLPEVYAATNVIEVYGDSSALIDAISIGNVNNRTLILQPDLCEPGNLAAFDGYRSSLPWTSLFSKTGELNMTIENAGLYEVYLDLPVLMIPDGLGFRVNLKQTYLKSYNDMVIDVVRADRYRTCVLSISIGNVPFYSDISIPIRVTDLQPAYGTVLQALIRNQSMALGWSNLVTVGDPLPISVLVDDHAYSVFLEDIKSSRLSIQVPLSTGTHNLRFEGIDGINPNFIYIKPVAADIQQPAEITYKNVSPVSRLVHVNSSAPFFLVFSEAFSNGWRLYPHQVDLLGALQKVSIDESSHVIANGFANAWYIEKPGNYVFTLLYYPQVLRYAGIALTAVFVGCIIVCMIYFELRKIRTTTGRTKA